jgi:hypothetical protein
MRLAVHALTLKPGEMAGGAPPTCACCGALAADSLNEARRESGRSIMVPYCTACLFHASSVGTRRLAIGMASLLVALTLLGALPIVGLHLPVWAFVILVAAGGVLPIALGVLVFGRPQEGHTARGRAVWWSREGDQLLCTREAFAAEVAAARGARPRRIQAFEPVATPAVFAGVALATILAPIVHEAMHPRVRVLNLTGTRITIVADGIERVTVEPTSQESPVAGAEIALLVGVRALKALTAEGDPVDERGAELSFGADHLYALGASGVCFWLERTDYGRARAPGVAVRALEGLGAGSGFWSVHGYVDTWFAPNPDSGDDGTSTGGSLVALRHAPCLEAPGEVQGVIRLRPEIVPGR